MTLTEAIKQSVRRDENVAIESDFTTEIDLGGEIATLAIVDEHDSAKYGESEDGRSIIDVWGTTDDDEFRLCVTLSSGQ